MNSSSSSTVSSSTAPSSTASSPQSNNVNDGPGPAAASTPKNVDAVTKVYDNWGLLKWIRPSAGPLDFSSAKRTVFVVLEHDATTLIIYDKDVCRLFNGKRIQEKCLALFPIHGATVYDRIDLDCVAKSCFYFVIKDITGNPVDLVVLAAPSVDERDRWVQKLQRMGCVSRNLGVVQRQNEDLRWKLKNASNLLKIDVGETLISNLITGKYNNSQKYKDLREHLNEFVTIWEQVWRNKRIVHGQLLNLSTKQGYATPKSIIHDPNKPQTSLASEVQSQRDKTVVGRKRSVRFSLEEEGSEPENYELQYEQPQALLLNKVIRGLDHVEKQSIMQSRLDELQLAADEKRNSRMDLRDYGDHVNFPQEGSSTETESSSDATEPDTYEFQYEAPEALLLNKVIRGMDHVRKKSIMQSRIDELHLESDDHHDDTTDEPEQSIIQSRKDSDEKEDIINSTDERPAVLMLNKVIRGMDHVRKKSIVASRMTELRLDSASNETK